MRNLFLRIFVSFWASMALVLALTVVATLLLAENRLQREQERQDEFARQASVVLATDGVSGLKAWLGTELPTVAPDQLYVLDRTGADLLGRQVPGFLQASLGRAPYPSQKPGDEGGRNMRLLSQLVSTRGDTYSLSLLRQRRGGPFGIFGDLASFDTLAIITVITALISALVCYLLARFLSAPIDHLRAATRSIASGDLSVRVAGLLGRRRDELAMLAQDFDGMAERLRALLQSHQQLLRDVSHELRSPLARLQIALGLARRPSADLEQEFDRIERETQRLDELIGEILSLSRLDDPARSLELEPVSFGELLDVVAENARMEGEPENVKVDLQVNGELTVRADRELLFRAVENVVRNAVRFSPAGAVVRIEAEAANAREVRVRIRDRGPGVPEGMLEKIFEPFYRVSNARDRDSGGYGIGLAITSRVIGLHGGSVKAGNENGGGLCVEIRLPRAQDFL
ncbi:MAG TPA: ATP-binding protein [Steroidobacteraceae bacterium]|nr:ATP-binding protein [Steroidobacteraceae bacterium]